MGEKPSTEYYHYVPVRVDQSWCHLMEMHSQDTRKVAKP